MLGRHRQGNKKKNQTTKGGPLPRRADRATAPRVRVTRGTAARSAIAAHDCPPVLPESTAATATCFDQFPGKQNRAAAWSSGLRAEANLQNSVRRATAPIQTGHLGRNAQRKSDRSKKDRSASALTTGLG